MQKHPFAFKCGAAVLFMLKSPWLNWGGGADLNSDRMIKRSKVRAGVSRGGPRHAEGTVQNADAGEGLVNSPWELGGAA